MKISFYENVAKNTFINGIKEPYHSFLTHFELNDIEDCLNKCRRHDNHEQQANFLSYMRQRESKPKANLFNAPSTSKAAISYQPRPAIAQTPFRPALPNFGNNNLRNNNFGNNNLGNNDFGNNNFGNSFRQNNNNNNQAIRQNYQPTPMSISTRNTNRPGGNQTNRPNNLPNNSAPRTNNFFRSTGPPNFVAEELHHQEDQQNCVAQENDYPEEQPQNLVNETAEIDETENFQIDPIVSEET